MHATTFHGLLRSSVLRIAGYGRSRSTARPVGSVIREVRFPVRVHRPALLIESAGRGELVMTHLRAGRHDASGGVEHQKARVRGYLEVIPRNRHVFFIDPKNPCLLYTSD